MNLHHARRLAYPRTMGSYGIRGGHGAMDILDTQTSTTTRYIAIGASGPDGFADLVELLAAMPAGLDAVFMVVLHRPSSHPSYLRAVLETRVTLPVVIASEAQALLPGTCYIGAPAEHLTLTARGHAGMIDGQQDAYRNRTVDLLFESVGRMARERAVGIVLSGSLDDGSRGLSAIGRAGGITMVLEPGDKPRGMQQNAIEFDGPVDLVGTSNELAQAICKLLGVSP
jgi:two-component system, chemotaxis family, protein-glutamate methylesterase/glutaminase